MVPFSAFYLKCTGCNTLVNTGGSSPLGLPTDGSKDFYGLWYWFTHLKENFHQPDIVQRARQDLGERCIHWLRSVLKYKLPPARALELGCAHGGFVALLRFSGFDATGLEINPRVVEFAKNTFQIPMLLGPLEEQQLEAGSLDLIVLMDVLEHFPDPLKTMRHCLTLLKPDGILLVQTPRYPEGRSHDEMLALGDPFLQQLKDKEHIFLFSESSIRDLFLHLAVPHMKFEPAIFSHYDMFLVASREPFTLHSSGEIEEALNSSPSGRMALTLLDLYGQNQQLLQEHRGSEADRGARLEQIQELSSLLQEADADRAARLEKIQELSSLLQEADADRAARLEKIQELSSLLQEADADRAARLEKIQELSRLLQKADVDRVARLEKIQELSRLLHQVETDRDARMEQIHELDSVVRNLETDLSSLREEIARLTRQMEESKEALASQMRQARQLSQKLQESETERAAQAELIQQLERVQKLAHRFYAPRTKQILSRIGLHDWLLKKILNPSPFPEISEQRAGHQKRKADCRSEERGRISCVAVDLTPLLPGVENGGAKLLALELVRYLSRLLGDCKFVLLTPECSHEELACLDAPNVQRLCIKHHTAVSASLNPSRRAGLKVRFREWLVFSLPSPLIAKLKTVYRSLRAFRSRRTSGILRELGADLLFCPFTMPFYHDPAIPTVSVVYDLQYHYYPQFFNAEDRLAREYHFKETCRLAGRLICISEYVRGTVLENFHLPPEHVVSIPIRLLGHLKPPSAETILTILAKHGLVKEEFFLYPANFWPHKNHPMLLTAFGMFHSRHPESKLRLVCTGSPDGRMEDLREASRRMGLGSKVLFPGFLPDEGFAALLASCRALIFPSLYEGFGMPVLEAMVFGKPVLCSNLSSLPEVAGDAAILFDPKKPHDILMAIERILQDPELVSRLIVRGTERAASWGDGEQMAREYSAVFRDALNADRRIPSGVHGLYSDGWTQERVIVAYDACPETRLLEMVLELPPVQPSKRLSVRISDEKNSLRTYLLTRGNQMSFRHPLSKKGGFVEFRFNPSFQPKECGMSEDQRWLGCLVRDCAILTVTQRNSLLERGKLHSP